LRRRRSSRQQIVPLFHRSQWNGWDWERLALLAHTEIATPVTALHEDISQSEAYHSEFLTKRNKKQN